MNLYPTDHPLERLGLNEANKHCYYCGCNIWPGEMFYNCGQTHFHKTCGQIKTLKMKNPEVYAEPKKKKRRRIKKYVKL
jgi:hypothetical protein